MLLYSIFDSLSNGVIFGLISFFVFVKNQKIDSNVCVFRLSPILQEQVKACYLRRASHSSTAKSIFPVTSASEACAERCVAINSLELVSTQQLQSHCEQNLYALMRIENCSEHSCAILFSLLGIQVAYVSSTRMLVRVVGSLVA